MRHRNLQENHIQTATMATARAAINVIITLLFVFQFQFLQIAESFHTRLSTRSRWIVEEASGRRVKLTCVNWPSHLEPMIAEGLSKKPVQQITRQIVAAGFNCVRFTWPTYMYTRPEYGGRTIEESLDKRNLTAGKEGIKRNNPGYLKMTVREVHKEVVREMGKARIMVVLDNHVSLPKWCCHNTDGNGFFGDIYFDPVEWLRGLAQVARDHKDQPAVVAISMRNELRGQRQNQDDWYKYMQQGANTIHRENPKLLVIVSGLNTATNLGFLRSRPFAVDFHNKLVFEAHWYAFGTTAEQWTAGTNRLCKEAMHKARYNYLFVTDRGNDSFPLFISEFGIDNRGVNEADNRYIGCFLASVAETDVDWALWSFQGSYIFREGEPDHDEAFGVVDSNWDRLRNPALIDRLQMIRQTNQDYRSKHPMHYKMFHPLSGLCVQISKKGAVLLANCKYATWWEQHQDGGAIKLYRKPLCLTVAGDGQPPVVSKDCSSKWKYVSSSGLHVAAQDGEGKHFCLENNGSQILTKKCLCVGDDNADLPTCSDNPEVQWFKLVPTNV